MNPSEATLNAATQSRISPIVTCAPVYSRNVTNTSARRHDSLAKCVVTAFTELDKIIATLKPSCSATRRIRSKSEMPQRSVNASGESATINNGGRQGSVISGVCGLPPTLPEHSEEQRDHGKREENMENPRRATGDRQKEK